MPSRHRGWLARRKWPAVAVLANLFLHYALDRWLATYHRGIRFCRYADDGILHCRTEAEAYRMRELLDARLRECGLQLHPEKTRVVYCKDSNRSGTHRNVQFEFLGYTFRPRFAFNRAVAVRFRARDKPARSPRSAKSNCVRVRRDRAHRGSRREYAPAIRGWIGYYCRFYGSAFAAIARYLDAVLVRWAMRKFKRLRGHQTRARSWLAAQRRRHPGLFPHWRPLTA